MTQRKVARASLGITYDDGTVMTFTADNPHLCEVDLGLRLPALASSLPDVFSAPWPPDAHRAVFSFFPSLMQPVGTAIRQAATVADPGAADREFLLRLLQVTAADTGLDPAGVEFAVVTAGNGPRGAVSYWPWEKGEIVAVPVDGYRDLREGRSFAKYDIGHERFGRDYAAAKRRSDEVKAAPDRDWTVNPGQRA